MAPFLGLILGLLLFFYLEHRRQRRLTEQKRQKWFQRQTAEQKRLEAEFKNEEKKLRERFENERRSIEESRGRAEALLTGGQETLLAQEHRQHTLTEALAKNEEILAQRRLQLAQHREGIATQRGEHLNRLAQRADLDLLKEREKQVAKRVDRALGRLQKELEWKEERLHQNRNRTARRMIESALSRYDTPSHLQRNINFIPCDVESLLQAYGDDSSPALQAFREATQCWLEVKPEKGFVVRGDSPRSIEVARRSFRQIVNKELLECGAITEVVQRTEDEVDREAKNAAKKAFRKLCLKPAQEEIMELLGTLKFRLSYSQNQWRHAVEVGFLAGLLAEELGLDSHLARRGGLLHDIGKALTHEQDGGHAVLGAVVARRCGEEEVVANSIGAHHNDEPPSHPLAYVVAAADALSGARPGARREPVMSYMNRIRRIRDVVRRFVGVQDIDIMEGGREIRVTLQADDRGDLEPPPKKKKTKKEYRDSDLYPLAQDIARTLEDEVIYAGQIRVTVLRESRSIALAR